METGASVVDGAGKGALVNITRLVGLVILLVTLAAVGYAVWVLVLWRS